MKINTFSTMPRYLILAIILAFPFIAAQECSSMGDQDQDGLANNMDNCPEVYNPEQQDTDADEIGDICDPDDDNDGVEDELDNCPFIANASQANADGDFLGDGCDPCPDDKDNDQDRDRICAGYGFKEPMTDDQDNCPKAKNAAQTDTDNDGRGDACDLCMSDPFNDADSDGICGDVDNCLNSANSDQQDTDGDTIGDVCDACPIDHQNDRDEDSVCGDVDNCPDMANQDQDDCDGDGLGDACDGDISSCGPEMVIVPAGTFWRGSCNEASTPSCRAGEPGYSSSLYSWETPIKEIALSTYAIDTYEVTVAKYRLCVAASKCAAPGTGDRCNWSLSDREDHPVNCVSWFNAVSYANWLSDQKGLTPCYNTTTWEVDWNCSGYRLPTEAEWEKAARGSDGGKYPWGNAEPTCNLLNYNSCVGSSTPVGIYSAGVSPYGGYDMSGNVVEWVNDWYMSDYYSTSPTTDPQGPAHSPVSCRVTRGGGWDQYAFDSRAAFRGCSNPNGNHYMYLGFRLAQSVQP
jgi:formylglycine-generating enzyme required for sulfatase activity